MKRLFLKFKNEDVALRMDTIRRVESKGSYALVAVDGRNAPYYTKITNAIGGTLDTALVSTDEKNWKPATYENVLAAWTSADEAKKAA